jgi:serpin B
VLLGAALVVVVLLAVGIPWTLSAVRGDATLTSSGHSPAGPVPRIAARHGAAVELSAAGPPDAAPPPADPGPVATAEVRFALALLGRTGAADQAVSPASLALALAMLETGARGATLAEMKAALHADSLTGAQFAAGWAALVRAWTAAARAGGTQLHSANSLWTGRGLPVRPAFLAGLHQWFRAGVWQADFAHHNARAVDAINAWTARNTHGRIAKLFDRLPADTSAVLANAIYFDAAWQQPFDPHRTQDATFIAPDGPMTASFMSMTGTVPTSVTAGYTAVQLPYRGNRFAALAIMPTSGSLGDFVAGLDADRLRHIVAGLHTGRSAVRMPRFTANSTLDLGRILTALGMRTAFTDAADFSGVSRRALRVSQVVQRVYLGVAEKGTEAAAATGTVLVPTTAVAPERQTIVLDHPFLVLVRDTTTGAILFACPVAHPRR